MLDDLVLEILPLLIEVLAVEVADCVIGLTVRSDPVRPARVRRPAQRHTAFLLNPKAGVGLALPEPFRGGVHAPAAGSPPPRVLPHPKAGFRPRSAGPFSWRGPCPGRGQGPPAPPLPDRR